MSLDLRKYLLATGERGLGMFYVECMPIFDFEHAWVMMQLVNQASTKEGREQMSMLVAADTADKLDAGEIQQVDPSKMTPEELEAWAQEWQTRHYNQET